MKATDTPITHTMPTKFLPKLTYFSFLIFPMINRQASSDRATERVPTASVSMAFTALLKHSGTLATLPGMIRCTLQAESKG